MPSIHGSLDQFQALIRVSVARFDTPANRETVIGLIDTGATRTCLTRSLIGRLLLPMRGKMLVAGANGWPERRPAYAFSFGLHHDDAGHHVFEDEFVAPDFYDNDTADVLVGMDLIVRGRLIFEAGTFSFSF